MPETAAGWRVRRMKQKGAPEVVYGLDGIPLVLPIEAELDDLRREAGTPGRYRLDPVDEGHRPIGSAPAGYVFLHSPERMAETVSTTSFGPPSDNLVLEAMRMNAELARSVIDRFPQMMEAAATLLRAADGAGLPARAPMATLDAEPDYQDDDMVRHAPAAGFDLYALIAQVVPLLMMGLTSGKAKLPALGALLDWRKAAPKEDTAVDEPRAPANSKPATTKARIGATSTLPPIDPKTMSHFLAIQNALTAEEGEIARVMAKNLSPSELRAWFDDLSELAVPAAAERIRRLLGTAAHKSGGAS